ncbi:guanine deaminase [Trichogramma pretiosum]|uniref:Guanine deaminase n=1 Tax=Trichogramma kaykai TaxID=54128 RepID=A0ABD2XCA7_9HYME|nr:guanine deaminase [Trichogramma pretiosum]XP_014238115.1 guanine deaminase [Trichogramma pretiosum]
MKIEHIVGPVIHTTSDRKLVIHDNVRIDLKDGKIERFTVNPGENNLNKETTRYLKNGEFLIPGLIDGHIHAVQFPNLGIGYDKCLLDWLDAYTFPLEKKYSDAKFAEKVFDAVVRRTLKMGTTTACYYASIHEEASLILAKKAIEHGQRALVGKVNMNSSKCNGYSESCENSMSVTEAFINKVQKLNSPLIQPVITPRFALSCDMKLMKLLGDLAKKKNIHIQTHISENKDEVLAVREAYNEHKHYADVYDVAGLLTDKTVLAHGVYLTDSELEVISKQKTAVIHCPASNTCLKSGLCDVRRLQAANVKVGLGTDVSGGNFPSILDVMRAALQVSAHLSFIHDSYKPLTYEDVFCLATLGGAEALALSDKVGNFEVGKEFDALVIDLDSPNSVLDNLQSYTLQEKLQRLIYSGDDRNIMEVYVSGQRVV